MNRRILPLLGLIPVAFYAGYGAHSALAGSSGSPEPASRNFEFTYQVHFPATPHPGTARLWIPLPQADGYQDIQNLHVDSPVRYARVFDPEYKNRIALFKPTALQAAAGFDVSIHFVATRREHRVLLTNSGLESTALNSHDPALRRYLEPDRLVPLDGAIAKLAEEHTSRNMTPIEKARSIYEYVVSTMRYDKSGEGWGRGDAVWACTSKRGNCTDFHSLFIGMMRASGIPARFEIGFPLPQDKSEGDISGYHCWAEFYVTGIGWIPVDASEAWKNPAKRDYFFGAHDVNRVFFTYGRDIRLSTEQKGAPLNYFIYPYAEVDGRPVANLQTHFSFRDVAQVQKSARL